MVTPAGPSQAGAGEGVPGVDDEWDTEIELRVIVKIRAKPDPEFFEGWLGRTPEGLAQAALWTGLSDPSRIDGYADLVGDVDVRDIEVGP